MDNTKELTVLSLCAGYGGLELGLARALENPLRIVAVEVEAYALANLVAKAETGKLAIEALWPDLRTFPAERFRGCFDFILAGYPCQPFSVAGKRQGTDDPRHLWPYIARIVQAVQPIWCFFENVAGHLTLGFPEVYRSLRDMGYSVEAGLFTAAECGAPHKRQRLFILAKSSGASGGNQDGQADGETRQQDVQQGHRTPCPIRLRAASQLADARPKDNAAGMQSEAVSNGSRLLADASKYGLQGSGSEQLRAAQSTIESSWPARLSQPQYEWEEPRVVGNASGGVSRPGGSRRARQSLDEGFRDKQQQTQSSLGRAANGPRNRMDRLRLCGNGVVPQQAEKAFRTLFSPVENK